MNSITEKDSVSGVLIVLGEGTNMKSFYNEIWRSEEVGFRSPIINHNSYKLIEMM